MSFSKTDPSRTVHHADALKWLAETTDLSGSSFIASLPDYSEFPSFTLAEWREWFIQTARRILEKCPADGVVIFFQTDIKHRGTWVDKGYLCQRAAELSGIPLLWHKIVCRSPPGNISFGRPGYSHLLCFSRGIVADLAKSSVDVLPSAGEVTWTRGMGVHACRLACRFILSHTNSTTVVNPFCGQGTVLAVANALGLDAIGIEHSTKRVRKARGMTLEKIEKISVLPIVREPPEIGTRRRRDKTRPQKSPQK